MPFSIMHNRDLIINYITIYQFIIISYYYMIIYYINIYFGGDDESIFRIYCI